MSQLTRHNVVLPAFDKNRYDVNSLSNIGMWTCDILKENIVYAGVHVTRPLSV